jgi:hypothetical protein
MKRRVFSHYTATLEAWFGRDYDAAQKTGPEKPKRSYRKYKGKGIDFVYTHTMAEHFGVDRRLLVLNLR